jgi:hypothetical protein
MIIQLCYMTHCHSVTGSIGDGTSLEYEPGEILLTVMLLTNHQPNDKLTTTTDNITANYQ